MKRWCLKNNKQTDGFIYFFLLLLYSSNTALMNKATEAYVPLSENVTGYNAHPNGVIFLPTGSQRVVLLWADAGWRSGATEATSWG